EFLLRFIQVARSELKHAKRQVDTTQLRAQFQRLSVFALGRLDLPLRGVRLGHKLVGARRIVLSAHKPVEGALQKLGTHLAEIVQNVGIIRASPRALPRASRWLPGRDAPEPARSRTDRVCARAPNEE